MAELCAHPPEMENGGRGRIRVLLVDDDRDVADSLAEVLRLLDYDVRVAYSGEGALGIAGRYRPDVVILDINMPGMNGLLAARELKRDRRLNRQPFIAHTAADEPLVRQIAEQIGFRHFVVKGGESLTAIVNALMDVPEPSPFQR